MYVRFVPFPVCSLFLRVWVILYSNMNLMWRIFIFQYDDRSIDIKRKAFIFQYNASYIDIYCKAVIFQYEYRLLVSFVKNITMFF